MTAGAPSQPLVSRFENQQVCRPDWKTADPAIAAIKFQPRANGYYITNQSELSSSIKFQPRANARGADITPSN